MQKRRLPPSPYLFPDPQVVDPDGSGMIATGGDLAPATILAAYRQGLFPWFSDDDPICWWSPDPRCIIDPHTFRPSKSLQRNMRKNQYTLTLSRCFRDVIEACAGKRNYADGTWINADIMDGYTGLHHAGLAHSVEVWEQDQLVGGLYGVQLGNLFFGESMFSERTDVSKMAFTFLMQLSAASGFAFVDCQLPNNHLMNLGATTLPRPEFLHMLKQQLKQPAPDWSGVQQQRFDCAQLLTNDPFSGLIKL
jgi:leucyl/phenylalanyl-tRNA--protein transferase